MCNAIFSDSQMENVQFIGTVLKGSQFTNVGIHDARLTKADLGRARLTRVTFGLTSNIEGVIFDEAILTNVHFSTKSLKNVRFHGSTLVDTDFREVNSCAGVSFASADLSRILVSREMRQDFDPDTEFAPLYKCLREATSIKKIKVSKTFNKWLQNKDKKLASSTEIRRNENTATAERDSPNEGAFLAVPNETPKCNPEMGIVRDLIVQPKFSTPAESSTQQKGLPPFDRQRIIDN